MIFDVEDFWLPADGDNYTPAVMRAQQSVTLYTPIEIRFSNRLYTMEERLDIIRPFVSLLGEKAGASVASAVSTPSGGIPTLYWPNGGAAGIDISYPGRYSGGTYGPLVVASDAAARGDWFKLQGLMLTGPGVTDAWVGDGLSDHGISAHFTFQADDFAIRGFRGCGIYVNTSTGSAVNLGNANGSRIGKGSIYSCGAPAIWVGGGDANQIVFTGININECGVDMATRGGAYSAIAVGQEIDTITINDALPGTLYRLVVAGTNIDHTTPGSGQTTTTIGAGLVTTLNAALTNQKAHQISSTEIVIYGTNSASFTCTTTGSVGSMTVSETVATTATPQAAYCFGGPEKGLRLGDNASVLCPGQAWRGILRGDVTDHREGFGYTVISSAYDRVSYLPASTSDASISLPGGTPTITVTNARAYTALNHSLQSVVIFGSADEANNGTFPTTRILSGVYGASSVRFKVMAATPAQSSFVIINGTRVHVDLQAGDTTVSLCKDRFVSSINAAAIAGVTSTSHDTDEFNIVGTDVIAQPGNFLDNTVGTGRTIIEYTNASAVAEASWMGQFFVDNKVGVRGLYTGYVYGRGAQILDQPLISSYYANCLINGPSDGDGYWAKGGYSKFTDCYTEGLLLSCVQNPAEIIGGSMQPAYAVKTSDVGSWHELRPMIKSGLAQNGDGAVRGVLGDESYLNSVGGWEELGDVHGDEWRLMKAQTSQGDGLWELMLNPGTTAKAAIRIGALDSVTIGPASVATGLPGMYFGYANGTLSSPSSIVPNGANGATTTADSDNTGATGYVEWRINPGYNCRLDVIRVFPISTITGASHASASIGTHLFPTGSKGRCIIRNASGTGGFAIGGGDHQWTRNAASSIFLEDLSGANQALTGTHTSLTGIAIICRLIAYVYQSGTTFAPSTGNWIVGDRAVNLKYASGDATEWICTTTGIGSSSAWTALATIP